MHNITVLTRLSAATGVIAVAAAIAAAAAPAQAATRDGGGIVWEPMTCELAIRNASADPVTVLVETDVHEHPGLVLRSNQEPLVEYAGNYTRSKLLGRVAAMPDRQPGLDLPAGQVASFAIPCDGKEALEGLSTAVFVKEPGESVSQRWSNPYWPGHQHTEEGHVLLTVD